MRKLTIFLFALLVGAFAMSAQPTKAPMRSTIYNTLPSGFVQAGESSIYYSIDARQAAGPGTQYGISILGEIDGQYYSSTYGGGWSDNPGAGFITAMQVNGGEASYLQNAGTSTIDGVTITPSVTGQGDVAALIVYTIVNNNNSAVTVNVGSWADVYIGTNDYAPISRLKDGQGRTYALDLKESLATGAPLLCVLFGEGITGVTPIDDFWFGTYNNNYEPNEIVGNYDDQIPGFLWGTRTDPYWMSEDGGYDSGIGFCWKNRTIEAGETLELSFLISVGNIPFDDPVDPDPEPGEDRFTYEVEAYDIPAWNDLTAEHPAHIWGYYEHPYGQDGYIEFMVDGTRGEWTRIETPLTSGEEYNLDFMMMFDQDITDIHTLRLRFNDGLDNVAELDGLEWQDVRSISITGLEDRVYNGYPQIFNVTIGGVETYTLGENGEYTNPGDYTYSIEGIYEMNTIGVNAVEFTIDKGQSVVDVTMPESLIEYDGNPHGATVVLVVGDGNMTVTYMNTATGQASTEAPTQAGNYIVVVMVTETEFYYGLEESYGPYEIYETETAVKELIVVDEENAAWYTIDGRRVVAPTAPGIYIHNGKKYIVK